MIAENLKKFSKKDILSLSLFALYKIKDIPDYRVLSELAFALDKDSMLNIIELFGGNTIEIPTLDDLQNILFCLLVWENVQSGNDFEASLSNLKTSNAKKQDIRELYPKLAEVMKNYEFQSK